MKKHNYKILVLSNLNKSAATTIKSTISLAKMIGGSIDFFHIKKPTEVVDIENQLSAIRNINEDYSLTRNKMQAIVAPLSEKYGVKIACNFTIGNVKNELQKYIQKTQPDIIVLSKRKSKRLNFIGDSVTNFILNDFGGVIFMVSETNAVLPNEKISVGLLNGNENAFQLDFSEDLMAHMEKPLKSFNIVNRVDPAIKSTSILNKESIEYDFDQGDNAFKNLSKYVTKNNINLLYIDRLKKQKPSNAMNAEQIGQGINNLDISLLVGKR